MNTTKTGGRPRKDSGDKKQVISFRTDSITRRHLDRLVKKANKMISEVLREAVKNATIEKSVYLDYLKNKKELTQSDLLGLIVINAFVMEALPKDIIKIMRNFNNMGRNLNTAVKYLGHNDYNQLVWDYANLKDEVDEIFKTLMDFISRYRQEKEAEL